MLESHMTPEVSTVAAASCHARLTLLITHLTNNTGRELQQTALRRHMRQRHRTTTTAEDEALAEAAALQQLQLAASPSDPFDGEHTDSTDPAPIAAAAVSPCTSTQFEWPASSGFCWIKRDSGGVQQGPGSNVFKNTNVAVNAQDELVLTVLNPQNK